MTVFKGQVTDKAAPEALDPTEITTESDAVTGLTAVQTGLGDPDTEHGAQEGGTVLQPDFCVAGALTDVDDATFVDPGDGSAGANTRFFPGNVTAFDYANEAKVAKRQGGTGGARATGSLSMVTNPTATDTITIGVTVYTFVAAADEAGEVTIGADADASSANLAAAINGDALNVAHPLVIAEAKAGGMAVQALDAGLAGNDIATTETLTDLTDAWDAVTLENGSNYLQAHSGVRPVGVTSDVAIAMGL